MCSETPEDVTGIYLIPDGDGVFDQFNCCLALEELRLSPGLHADIRAWVGMMEEAERTSENRAFAKLELDKAAFAATGLALAKRLKAERPDLAVRYWDLARLVDLHAAGEESPAWEAYVYEVDEAGPALQ